MKNNNPKLSAEYRHLNRVTKLVEKLDEKQYAAFHKIAGSDINAKPDLALGLIFDLADILLYSNGLRREISLTMGQSIAPKGSRELLLYTMLLLTKPTPEELKGVQDRLASDMEIKENEED